MFRNPTTDLIIVLVIVLLIFGPKRLPGLGKQLGHGLREFKDSITGDSKASDDEQRPEIAATSAPPIAGATVTAQPTPVGSESAPTSSPPANSHPAPAGGPATPAHESAERGS
jgi:sec-independent protein translocase protein TatA